MNDTYILSFVAGTSGRFLASILWNIINDIDIKIEFTPYNSAHLAASWTKNWDVGLNDRSFPSFPWSINGPDAYNIFNFTENIGIMTTHLYPKWDIIRERFPSTKVIIIQYNEHDTLEMVANNMYKNGFDLFLSGSQKDKKSIALNLICEIHKELFNTEYDGSYELPVVQIEQIFNKMLKKLKPKFLAWSKFITVPVPPDFIDKTLILPYQDMFNTDDTLTKIMNFTGHSVNTYTKESYITYVDNRKKLIETKMPWLLI